MPRALTVCLAITLALVLVLAPISAARAQTDGPTGPRPTVINVDDQDYIINDYTTLRRSTIINVYGGGIYINATIDGNGAWGGHANPGERCGVHPASGGDGAPGYSLTLRTYPSRTGSGLPAGPIVLSTSGFIMLRGGNGGNGGSGASGGWFWYCTGPNSEGYYRYCYAQNGNRGGHGGAGGDLTIQSGAGVHIGGGIDCSGGNGGPGGHGGGYGPDARSGTNDPNGNAGIGGLGGHGGDISISQSDGAVDTEDPDFTIYRTMNSLGGSGGSGGNGGGGGTSEGFAGEGRPGGDGGSVTIASVTDLFIHGSPGQFITAGAETSGGQGGRGGYGGGGGGGMCYGCGAPQYVQYPNSPCWSPAPGYDPCNGSIGKHGGKPGDGGSGGDVTISLASSQVGSLDAATFRTWGGRGGDAGDTGPSGNTVGANCSCDGLPSTAATAGANGGHAGSVTISGAIYSITRSYFSLIGGDGALGGWGGVNGSCDGCTTPGEQGGAGGAGGDGGHLILGMPLLVAGGNDLENRGGNGGDGQDGRPGHGQGGIGGAKGVSGTMTFAGTMALAQGYTYTFTDDGEAVAGEQGDQASGCDPGGGE